MNNVKCPCAHLLSSDRVGKGPLIPLVIAECCTPEVRGGKTFTKDDPGVDSTQDAKRVQLACEETEEQVEMPDFGELRCGQLEGLGTVHRRNAYTCLLL